MTLDFSTYLTDLPIDSETVAILRDYSVHTVRDLGQSFGDERFAAVLTDEQRIELVEAFWAWIGLPLGATP